MENTQGGRHKTLTDVAPLAQFQRVLVLTGAGVSVASGLPTFRGLRGLWTDAELRNAASTASLDSLPAVWDLWGRLRQMSDAAEPNEAHKALARVQEQRGAAGLSVITQNVDGLHQRAGSTVLELHGSGQRARCMDLACAGVVEALQEDAPACPVCQGPTRPDLVLFGEALPTEALSQAEELARACDLYLALGTSGTVWPVSELVSVARRNGALCVSLAAAAPEHPHPDFHHHLVGRAEEELPNWSRSQCGKSSARTSVKTGEARR